MNILQSAITKLGNKIEIIGTPTENNILIIGVFHGDEPQGKYLIEKYLNCYSPSPCPSPQRGEGTSINSLSCFSIRGGDGLQYFHAHNYTVFSKIKSKELRQNSTDSEKKLWNILRNNQIHNLHFKRQKPIGKYIVDFVCLKEKIIIELDGGQHNIPENIQKDKERTAYLNSLGFRVLRIWNNEITENFEGVVEYLYYTLAPLGRGTGRGANNLLFIPCLNPDGMQNNTRTNANGVDLNRNFPTKNWGEDTSAAGDNPKDYYGGKSAGSEIETKFVIDIIDKYQPKLILTLHAPYKIVNYDGPAQDIAQKISDIIGYPVEPNIGYPTPGSFGTYCGVERNIPTITLELDEKIPVAQLEQPVFEIFDSL